jgi:predicted nucleic acid-binding protein
VLRVVVDANVLVSAIFNPEGPVSDVFFEAFGRVELLTPEFIGEEMKAHTGRIAHELGAPVDRIEAAVDKLIGRTRTVPLDMITKAARKQADTLALDIDPKDVAYVALALSQEAVLWTLDRKLANGLARKDVRICINTATMRNIIEHLR